jgi:hypothetical protein
MDTNLNRAPLDQRFVNAKVQTLQIRSLAQGFLGCAALLEQALGLASMWESIATEYREKSASRPVGSAIPGQAPKTTPANPGDAASGDSPGN